MSCPRLAKGELQPLAKIPFTATYTTVMYETDIFYTQLWKVFFMLISGWISARNHVNNYSYSRKKTKKEMHKRSKQKMVYSFIIIILNSKPKIDEQCPF